MYWTQKKNNGKSCISLFSTFIFISGISQNLPKIIKFCKYIHPADQTQDTSLLLFTSIQKLKIETTQNVTLFMDVSDGKCIDYLFDCFMIYHKWNWILSINQ